MADSIPQYITQLLEVPRTDTKPGGWTLTPIHSSGAAQFCITRVEVGGESPPHYHNENWDYAITLQGHGLIETTTKDGQKAEYPIAMGSFLSIPPNVVHRIVNTSKNGELVYLLTQAPKDKYDYVPQTVPCTVEGCDEQFETEKLMMAHLKDSHDSASVT